MEKIIENKNRKRQKLMIEIDRKTMMENDDREQQETMIEYERKL